MLHEVLILGANGRFGRNAADAFSAAGWAVRRFDRARDDLAEAVRGVDVVVNAWNPPDYSTWSREMLPLHRKVIGALRGTDATVIVPGNVYVFGPDTPVPWSEISPHAATNPLGRLRIRMESEYRASGVRTILLRAGDFLDSEPSGNWFDRVMAKGLARGRFTYPGNPDIPHAWAYLPDLARAAVALAERRDSLPTYADIPFPGYSISGREMAASLERVTGRPVRLERMNWLPLALLSPVMPMMRGLREMRYLWDTPHRLDGAALQGLLPDFAAMPLDEALAAAVAHIATPRAGQSLRRRTGREGVEMAG